MTTPTPQTISPASVTSTNALILHPVAAVPIASWKDIPLPTRFSLGGGDKQLMGAAMEILHGTPNFSGIPSLVRVPFAGKVVHMIGDDNGHAMQQLPNLHACLLYHARRLDIELDFDTIGGDLKRELSSFIRYEPELHVLVGTWVVLPQSLS